MMDHWLADTGSDERAYIVDRAHLLNRVFTDQVLWEQSLAAFAEDASLSATWVDGCGETQVVPIDRAFLDAHAKVVRSLLLDANGNIANGRVIGHGVSSGTGAARAERRPASCRSASFDLLRCSAALDGHPT